ncbi:MAG: ferredoxin, partial [Planctomycetota bacterium]
MALASRRTSSHDVCLKRVVTDTPIKKVWIEEGCISCKLCEDIVPQVFEVPDDEDCIVKPDAATHFGPLSEDID